MRACLLEQDHLGQTSARRDFDLGKSLPFGVETAAFTIELFGGFARDHMRIADRMRGFPRQFKERRWRSLLVKSAGQGHDGLAGKRESIDPKRRDRALVAGAALGPAPLEALDPGQRRRERSSDSRLRPRRL